MSGQTSDVPKARNDSYWKQVLRIYMEIYAFWAIAPNIIVHDDDDDDDDDTCYNILFITTTAVY